MLMLVNRFVHPLVKFPWPGILKMRSVFTAYCSGLRWCTHAHCASQAFHQLFTVSSPWKTTSRLDRWYISFIIVHGSGVVWTQISAYKFITHKLHTKSWKQWIQRTQKVGLSVSTHLHTRQMITEDTWVLWKESVHCLRTLFYFAESFDEPSGEGAFEMRHSFFNFFSLGQHTPIWIIYYGITPAPFPAQGADAVFMRAIRIYYHCGSSPLPGQLSWFFLHLV